MTTRRGFLGLLGIGAVASALPLHVLLAAVAKRKPEPIFAGRIGQYEGVRLHRNCRRQGHGQHLCGHRPRSAQVARARIRMNEP